MVTRNNYHLHGVPELSGMSLLEYVDLREAVEAKAGTTTNFLSMLNTDRWMIILDVQFYLVDNCFTSDGHLIDRLNKLKRRLQT